MISKMEPVWLRYIVLALVFEKTIQHIVVTIALYFNWGAIRYFGKEISARALAELAQEAEAASRDGFFLWDHILHSKSQRVPLLDPWVTLAAIAMTTRRIRIGTTLTPVARRRPWKLAHETVTLDHLSAGRSTILILKALKAV